MVVSNITAEIVRHELNRVEINDVRPHLALCFLACQLTSKGMSFTQTGIH